MTQNAAAADVRLFVRATAAAAAGAGGDGKFAYTMKQSLSAVSERRVERKNERATEAKAIDRDRRCNHAMQPARLNNVALRLNCSIEVVADPSVEQLLLCSFAKAVWGLQIRRRPHKRGQ